MGLILDPVNELTRTTVQVNVSKSANFNTTPVDVSAYIGNVLCIVSAGLLTAGDNNCTTDAAVWTGSESNGANATNASIVMTQMTNTAQTKTISVDTRAVGQYLKLVTTFGGANSPARPISVELVGCKRAQ